MQWQLSSILLHQLQKKVFTSWNIYYTLWHCRQSGYTLKEPDTPGETRKFWPKAFCMIYSVDTGRTGHCCKCNIYQYIVFFVNFNFLFLKINTYDHVILIKYYWFTTVFMKIFIQHSFIQRPPQLPGSMI